ncbi:MAG TPA: MATE family efflux transporter [Candidatus Hydrogenedentes bacterium]|nr:MATE family efflux transporter [Candidatus Hydrogenedentota bacterium]HOL76631.1 MATE family efflux transporter [Candidatus Hydrogenedentota bacterium]HPO84464.1 MATE family efflux transporter [Candidatus Hydrogenedentota bacterium]
MNDRQKEMAEEHIGRLLFRYSSPAIVAMMVNSTYNLVDTIFVGQGVGKNALAAMAVSFPIQMILLAVGQVVGIGSASIISRSLGANNLEKASRVAGASFANVIIASAIACILGLLFLKPLLIVFGATELILPYAKDYVQIILMGSFFFMFAVSSNNIARSEGNARVAMTSMLIGAIVNIVLDPLFIFVFKIGIRGAAFATVIGNICSFLFLISYFSSGKTLLKLRLLDIRPDPETFREMIVLGLPSFARVAAGSLFAIVLNHSVVYYGTELHLAITGVAHKILQVLFLPLIGIVQGLQPIVGFNYGAKNHCRVKEAFWKGVNAGTLFATFGFFLVMFFPRPILSLFNREIAGDSEAANILRLLGLMLPLIGFQTVGASLFQAIGKGLPALLLSVVRQVLFLVPLILTLPLFFGLLGVWLAFPVSDVLATAFTAFCIAREMRLINSHIQGPNVVSISAKL